MTFMQKFGSLLVRNSWKRFAILLGFFLIALLGVFLAGKTIVHAEGQNGTTLTADISVTPHYTRTFHWTIDKSVTPNSWSLFTGDSGTSQYKVSVTKDRGTDAAWLDGQVCVTNGGSVDTQDLAIGVDLTMPPAATVINTVAVDVSAHPVIAAGATTCYDYSITIPSGSVVPGGTYKVTANVTISNHSGHLGTAFGPSPSNTTILPATPTLINDSITVDDSDSQAGSPWTFNDTGSQSYTHTFTCDGDAGTFNNTATIRETGQSASASVHVTCYALAVSKSAATSFTRTYSWSINKSADQSNLTLALNQSFLVNYSVTVDAASTDSNFAANGTITVHNPAPMAATIARVTDVASSFGDIAVNCNVTFPYSLAANSDLVCNYTTSLPDASARINTGTATLQNYSYAPDLTATPSGTTFFSGSANIDFSTATITLVDQTISVTDTLHGSLGTVTAGADALPKIFTYSSNVGPYGVCGNRTIPNTASFTTNTTGSTGSASWTVYVNVPCNQGCTLTIGYWKTHAGFTGNNPDMLTKLLPIWLGTSGGTKSVQVTSASQAVTILSFNGDASNGINKLYAQELAAKLNIASGANGSAVSSTIATADAFLATHNAGDWKSLAKSQQAQVLSWVTTLDNFNNGLIGPGHCSQ